MPKNPEPEGSPRLITPQQIEQEHGIKRSTLYTYRHRPTFPKPVKVEGSIKTFYRADEVAAWIAANPKEQGKRTDLAPQPEGAAMPQKTEPPATEAAAKPDYLTDKQWADLVLPVLAGTTEGVLRAGLDRDWATDLATAAVKGLRVQLDKLTTAEEPERP